jgi:hypothetical protein
MGEGKLEFIVQEEEETETHLGKVKQKGDNGFHVPCVTNYWPSPLLARINR